MDHYFKPGNTEGKGRPPGAPNKRTNELTYRIKNRGDIDPAELLTHACKDFAVGLNFAS
jgi:hypothetical protein